MVLGIISLAVLFVGFCIPFSGTISIVTGIIGAIMGAKSRKIAKSGQATAGLVMSVVALALSAIWIIILLLLIIAFGGIASLSSLAY
jgi:hypothetical protein